MSPTAAVSSAEWTCSRCTVTSRWKAGSEPPELPPHWVRENGELHCLGCRREVAAEAGYEAAPADATGEERVRLRRSALIVFEIERDPDRTNGEIAKVVRCSIPAVVKVRKALEPAGA